MYIVFSTTGLPASILIRFFDNLGWWFKWGVSTLLFRKIKNKRFSSHTSIIFSDFWMLESHMSGNIRPNWWKRFKNINRIIHVFEIIGISKEITRQVAEEMKEDYYNIEYDFIGIFGRFLMNIGITNKNELQDENKKDCLEFVSDVLKKTEEKTGIDVFDDSVDASSSRLEEFKEILENNLKNFRKIDEKIYNSW